MRKRAISILLCLVMALTMVPGTAGAMEIEPQADDDFLVTPVGGCDYKVDLGDTVTLAVDVTAGDMSDVIYMWTRQKRGANHLLEYVTGPSLTLENITAEDMGIYECSVRYGYDRVYGIQFFVSKENHFSAAPVGGDVRKVKMGDDATLRVDVVGDDLDGLTYSWAFWGEYIEANTDSYTVTDVSREDFGEYFCCVEDAYGNYDYAYFHLSYDNHFSAVPVGETEVTVGVGDDVTLAVKATADNGEDIQYEWSRLYLRGEGGASYNDINNAHTDSLTLKNVTEEDADEYLCTVSDGYGNTEWIFFILETREPSAGDKADSSASVRLKYEYILYGLVAVLCVTVIALVVYTKKNRS